MITQLEDASTARSHHSEPGTIAREIVGTETAHVDETVDLQPLHANEQAEIDDTRDDHVELFTDLVLHVLAFQPGQRIASRLLGATLRERAMQTELLQRLNERVCIAAVQDMTNATMHDQVRIAANRRGEVHVFLQSQAEVPDVLRLICCVRQGTHDDRTDELCFLAADHLLQDGCQVSRLERAVSRQVNAETLQKQTQLLEPLLFGPAMYTIKRRNLVALEETSGLHVGSDHALLDEPMGVVARMLDKRSDTPVRIELHFELRHVELESTALKARRIQRTKYVVQIVQQRPDGVHVLILDRSRIRKVRGHLRVREASTRPYHGFEEPRASHLARLVNAHLAGKTQPVHVGIEGAQTVGQRL